MRYFGICRFFFEPLRCSEFLNVPFVIKIINVLASNGFAMMLTIIVCIDLASRLGCKPSTDRLHALDKQ